MQQYLLSIYQPDGDPPAPEVLEQIARDVLAVNEEMRAAGAWVFSGGLRDSATATVLDPRSETLPMTDGPYIEGQEHLGGLVIVRADSRDDALDWGAKVARATTLPVEVRAFHGDA